MKPGRSIEGTVVSNRMSKTVVVRVTRRSRHPVFQKTIVKVKKYKAHDEESACQIGDRVLLVGTRPLSREKRWRVLKVIGRATLVPETSV